MTDVKTVTIPQDFEKFLSTGIETVRAISATVDAIILTTPEDYQHAGDALRLLKAAEKVLGERINPDIKHAYEYHKLLVSEKKRFTVPLEKAEKALKDKILAYRESQLKSMGPEVNADEAMSVAQNIKLDGITFPSKWTFEIYDESQIPRLYMKPDTTIIRKYGESMGPRATIPGVLFRETENISAKSK